MNTKLSKLSDFDSCHKITYTPYDHDLTSIDVYVFSGNARRLVASFQDCNDAMDFAEELTLKIRSQSGAKILVVLRILDYIVCQVNIP